MPNDDTKALLEAVRRARDRQSQPELTQVEDLLSPPAAPVRPKVPRPDPRPEAAPDSAGFDVREAPTRAQSRRALDRASVQVFESRYPAPGDSYEAPDSVAARIGKVSAPRLLALIAAAAAGVSGVVAAAGAAVVNIIAALHAPSNAETMKRLDAMDVRMNGDFGLKLEVKTRQEKDEELKKEIEKTQQAQKQLEERLVVKVKPRSW